MLWNHKFTRSLPDIRLDGFRIYLRPPKLNDTHEWIKIREQNRDMLVALEPTWPKNALTPAFYRRRLERQIQQWDIDRAYPFFVFTSDNQKLIGGVNINHVCRGAADYASLGYWLDKDKHGQGYMSEALRLIKTFSFEDINLHRLHAAVMPHNKPSISLLERSSFQKEGFAEKYLQINGVWEDHILYGMTKEKWEEEQDSARRN